MALKVNQSIEFDSKYASTGWNLESLEFSNSGDKVTVNLDNEDCINLALRILDKALNQSDEESPSIKITQLQALQRDINEYLARDINEYLAAKAKPVE